MIASQASGYRSFDRLDARLITLVEGPLLDLLRVQQPCVAQNPHVFTQRRLTKTQLLGDEHRAHAVLHQISVNLRAKIRLRVLQPFEDLEPSLIADGPNCDQINHIASLPSDDLEVNDEQVSL
jgi:hypothetical protein